MTEQRGRVRITNPLTTASAPVRRTVQQEIDEDTGVGEVYMRSLIRSQLRAALTVVSTLVLTIGSLPILFLLAPGLSRIDLVGVPLPWVILGVGVYPVVLLVGWLYVRQVERSEQLFTALVEAPDREES